MEPDRTRQTRPDSNVVPYISAAVALLAGAVLRFWMLGKFFEVNDDSRIYGGIAKNLLLYGRYALTGHGGTLHSTLIRLPGYPLFLAGCFRIFGMENYYYASVLQIFLELLGCVLLGLYASRVSPVRCKIATAQATIWLAALCPFTAIYAAEPLTEALSVLCVALALWSAARFQDQPWWGSALAFTIAVTYAALLRPDGALVGIAFAPAIASALFIRRRGPARPAPEFDIIGFGNPRTKADSAAENNFHRAAGASSSSTKEWKAAPPRRRTRIALVCLLLALAPFTAWTWRNWRVFHVFEPLAPRYATDPGENTWPGFQRWMKTWSLDFVSTYEIYWNVPGEKFDLEALPARAFDSPSQYQEISSIAAAYEANGEEFSPAIDARFARLAAERIVDHPLRYYLVLPVGRVADMWLRPRVENLPIDLDWWVYSHHHLETQFSWFYAGLNAFYLALAIAGLFLRPRRWPWIVTYMVLRSLLLATIEAPEARYTLECFPMVFALGGMAVGRAWVRARGFAPSRIGWISNR